MKNIISSQFSNKDRFIYIGLLLYLKIKQLNMIAQALGMRINNPGHTHIIYISMVLLIL